jgi:hypothetical protein
MAHMNLSRWVLAVTLVACGEETAQVLSPSAVGGAAGAGGRGGSAGSPGGAGAGPGDAIGTQKSSAPTPASELTDGRYLLENDALVGQCLAEPDRNHEISGVTCDPELHGQRWKISAIEGGALKLESGLTGRSVDVAGAAKAPGSRVGTWPYGQGAKHRQFRPRPVEGGRVELEALHAPGLCLTLGAAGGGEIEACGAPKTRWRLFRVTPPLSVSRGLDAPGCVPNPTLPVLPRVVSSIAELGQPFDFNAQDLEGPHAHNSNYGKRPELVTLPSGTGLDVLMRDQSREKTAYLIHLEPQGAGFEITKAWELATLGTLMGLARDDAGLRYYATAIDEKALITEAYPPNGVHRPGIVRLVGFDETGCVRLEVDLDRARGWENADAELIINPMVAATSRLSFGNGVLSLVHGNNTEPDGSGTRHQKALTSHVAVRSGQALRTSTMWVSHSFDQRQLWDGDAFVELHLGDAYPRSIALGRFSPEQSSPTYSLFHIKGGGNPTHSRFGGIAALPAGDYGYLIAFTSERSGVVTDPPGNRDLALLRVRRDFASQPEDSLVVDPAGSEQQVTFQDGSTATNRVQWLTDLGKTDGPSIHADRPRLVALDGDRHVVTWERWNAASFEGTWGLVVDSAGSLVEAPRKIGDDHIPRSEDAVRLGNEAATVIGAGKGLVVTLLGPDLALRRVQIP